LDRDLPRQLVVAQRELFQALKAGYLRWDLAVEEVGREVEGNEAGEREQRGRQWAFEGPSR